MPLTRRRLMLLAAGAALAGTLPVRAAGDTVLMSGRAFGTSWHLRLRGDGDVAGLARAVPELLARIDGLMSPFRPDSALSAFNAAKAGWQAADPELVLVAEEALWIAALTGGAFDPSVGPDVGRYGFGPIRGTRVGDHTGLMAAPGRIGKADDRLTLDFCGIAKGFALDTIGAAIVAAGFGDHVAEFGGEVIAAGSDGGARWRVGIADPVRGGLVTQLDLLGLALATSGDAVNAYSVGGRRYSHIINPRTDAPIAGNIASVSVLAASAMTADGLATGLMAMGPEAGPDFAQRHGIAALFLLRADDGVREIATGGFDRHRLS